MFCAFLEGISKLTNTGTPIVAKFVAPLAVTAVTPRQVHTLRIIPTCAQTLSALIYVCREGDKEISFSLNLQVCKSGIPCQHM